MQDKLSPDFVGCHVFFDRSHQGYVIAVSDLAALIERFDGTIFSRNFKTGEMKEVET